MTLTVPTPNAGLAEHAAATTDPLGTLVRAWLAGYKSPRTRETYAIGVSQWLDWCILHGVDPLAALRAHVELYQRHLEQAGRKPRTIAARLNTLASFYGYLVDEDVLVKSPMRGVKRPKIERRSPTAWLNRAQIADLLTIDAEIRTATDNALLHVLALNGLRIGEACSLNVSSLAWDGYHPIIVFTRKGGKDGRATLSRPTEAYVQAAVEGRHPDEPMFLNRYGNRMTRINAQRIIDRAIANVRGTHGRITPHSLRHSWTTVCVDAHVPLDQLQHDGGWNDPRLIPYYSHGKDAPARHSTHAATAFVYGAA